MRHFFTLFLVLSSFTLSAQNQPPTVTIQEVLLDEGNQTLTINYDVTDAESEAVEIFFLVSADGGSNFNINTESATGDVGYPISPGTGKQISWNYAGAITDIGEHQLKIVADDRYEIDIQGMVDQVDSNLLHQRLADIVGVRHYIANLANLNRCRDTIEQSFLNYGLETFRQNFPYSNTTGQNIIGSLKGAVEDDAVVIIDGHYDTVNNSPGADDNGTATIGVLEAARILSQYRFKKTLRFIGFDLEEAGLRGSLYYSQHLPQDETFLGVLNMEMIGYYSEEPNSQEFPTGFNLLYPAAYQAVANNEFRGDFITNVGLQNFQSLSDSFDAAAAQYVPELKVIPITANPNLIPPDLLRSDHSPFWQAGIPALMLTNSSEFRNPYYHTVNDTLGAINFTFMSRVVKAVIATAAELAEPQHSTEATATVQITTGSEHQHHLACTYFVSPNPTGGALNIRFGECAPGRLDVELLNIQGQRLWQVSAQPLMGPLEIPAQDFPAGVYWLRLSDGAFFSTQRIIVQ